MRDLINLIEYEATPSEQWASIIFSKYKEKHPDKEFPSDDDLISFISDRYPDFSFERLRKVHPDEMIKQYQLSKFLSKRKTKKINKLLAQSSETKIRWLIPTMADFNIGNLFIGTVHFMHNDFFPEKSFTRGWNVAKNVIGAKTGLFLSINECLKQITEQFLQRNNPTLLILYGADIKRNKWNSIEYRKWNKPTDYNFFIEKNFNNHRATSDGVIGVGWVKKNYVDQLSNIIQIEIIN